MSSRTVFFTLIWVLMLPLSSTLLAQVSQPLQLERLTAAIELDGNVNEPAWQQVEPLPLVMYQPSYRGELSERTEIRIAYDGEHLYCAGRFFVKDASTIRANSFYRDRYSGDDTFGILLDTFNDNENGLWFWMTPNGVRADMAVSQDGNSVNDSWNTYWEVATSRDQQGWYLEARIPFSSLGFQGNDGQVTMGLTTYRFISVGNERQIFPDISTDFNWRKPSLAQRVILKDVYARKPVYVTPYALGGVGSVAEVNSTGERYIQRDDGVTELGADIKYNLTSNLTLDLTINTDFAQVEADDQQVNLTRFSLFFPEKRQFFQERAGIFSFGTAVWGSDRLFHSRRIGLNNGQAVRILGGARLVGRSAGWDIGFLNMQSGRSDNLPSENFGVVRLRRRVFNDYSYAGGMLISRIDENGNYNIAQGLDGIFRLFGDEYLTLRWSQTFDKSLLDQRSFNLADASSWTMLWQRRRQAGLNYNASISRTGKDFLPATGFITRFDYTEFFWWMSHDWYLDEASRFSQVSPIQFFGFAALRNQDNSLESAQLEYDTDFVFKSGGSTWADGELYYENLLDTLHLPENSFIMPGTYTFPKIEGGYNLPGSQLFRAGISFGFGKFYDGWRSEFGFSPTWNVSRFLELNAQYRANLIRFSDRDQEINSHIVRLRLQGALNTSVSVNAFLQYNSIDAIITPNVRFRYNFREGNDLWIVYNESFNSDRRDTMPFLPRSNARTVLIKYTNTFQF